MSRETEEIAKLSVRIAQQLEQNLRTTLELLDAVAAREAESKARIKAAKTRQAETARLLSERKKVLWLQHYRAVDKISALSLRLQVALKK
jgi:hypothetical protein